MLKLEGKRGGELQVQVKDRGLCTPLVGRQVVQHFHTQVEIDPSPLSINS